MNTLERGRETGETTWDDRANPILIEISDTQGHSRVDHARLLPLARLTCIEAGFARAAISIALVDDAAIHAINARHLGHDWPTDVITFPLSCVGEPVLAGEIVISVETAVRFARAAGHDPADELALYLVHGLLHLCGHDDREPKSRERMRRSESEMLGRAGITVPPVHGSDEPTREVASCSA